MSEQDDLLRKLRETISEQGIESLHLLEELIPLEEQMEYFRYFDKLRREDAPFVRDSEVNILFSPDEPYERKKRSLSLLASIPDVKAYRSIETYHSSPQEPELKNWSAMALVSSRIILNFEFLGQQQIYISSGLGGQDKKLRFFVLFTTANREPFTDLQKEMVEREFRFQMHQVEVEIEKLEVFDNYFTMLLLMPMDKEVRSYFNAAIEECNQYGNFLDTRFVFTNTKILSEKEITALLSKKSKD